MIDFDEHACQMPELLRWIHPARDPRHQDVRTIWAEVPQQHRAPLTEGCGQDRPFVPLLIKVRFIRQQDGDWSVSVTIGGPQIRANGSIGTRLIIRSYRTHDPMPIWAADYVLDHHPDTTPSPSKVTR
ncbi:hypothetical protein FHR81_002023 [Actinoalloteichus hoggarensis]|uniref:Uncharacterized protein n=1 Tax=Actinoalloteichus hoggarensis TaxID=1470176 RepID=A0A221W5T8_9PSEU|nr:hypothetical protein [Actinoalloteichus hoggarensis]ASO21054.1 hypothetical protein AHOG_17145 [Actinoalloteichus hoggarensis]MBB5920985.1 hypothetical protein [Actinoalloteichus hoggarensis]